MEEEVVEEEAVEEEAVEEEDVAEVEDAAEAVEEEDVDEVAAEEERKRLSLRSTDTRASLLPEEKEMTLLLLLTSSLARRSMVKSELMREKARTKKNIEFGIPSAQS